mmetsp:Transcript_393/g.615  ORF Transcript_393/g.615 Transcript_393/m.615 type:complete len:82 (+) Transcript_393:227-472(+)
MIPLGICVVSSDMCDEKDSLAILDVVWEMVFVKRFEIGFTSCLMMIQSPKLLIIPLWGNITVTCVSTVCHFRHKHRKRLSD